MVSQEKALQRLWKDACSVFIQSKQKNEITKRTEFAKALLFSNQPCKLSFEALTSTAEADHAPSVSQGAKLFISNALTIPPGSKIVVTRNGLDFTFKQSGESGVFTHHQEIPLELFEEWA